MPFQFSQVPATLQSSPGKPIVSAGAGHVEGIGFFANTTERDGIGAFFRQSDFIAFVGDTIYRYTGPAFTPANADAVMSVNDWTNTAYWTEISGSGGGGVSLPIGITDVTNLSTQLAAIVSDVSDNEGDISTNTGAISTNTGAISTNAANIATNTTNITSALLNAAAASAAASDNATDIAANTGNISTNATGVSTNAAAISTNTTDIASNTTDIGFNTILVGGLASDVSGHTTDISTNAGGIATNATGISTNAAAITAAEGDIATNTGNISTNAAGISTNATGVSTNAGGVSTNAAAITAVEGDVATNTGNISTNSLAISTNGGDISTNAGAITALQNDKLDTATFTDHTHEKADITDFSDADYTPSTTVATTETAMADWGSTFADIDTNFADAKIVYYDGTQYKHTSLFSIFTAMATMIADEAGTANNSLYGTQLGTEANPADLDGDGLVGTADLLVLLASYGTQGFGYQVGKWNLGVANPTGAGGFEDVIDNNRNPIAEPNVVVGYTPGTWINFDFDNQNVGLENANDSFSRATGTLSTIYDSASTEWVGFQTNTSGSNQYYLENSPNAQINFGASSYLSVINFEGPDACHVKRVLKGYDSSNNLLTFADGSDYVYEQITTRESGQALSYIGMSVSPWIFTLEQNENLNQVRISYEVMADNGNVGEVAIYDKVKITFP